MRMTENESIETLKLNRPFAYTELQNAVDMAIQALEEIQRQKTKIGMFVTLGEKMEISSRFAKLEQYETIGTIDEFKALKEKNEPKKVQYDEYGKEEGYPYCECGKCLIDDFVGVSYCPDCGQKLDWQ